MNIIAVAAIYIGMLAFDAAMLSGTCWLIVAHDWSTWWVLAAVFICFGSNLKYIIATAYGTEVREP